MHLKRVKAIIPFKSKKISILIIINHRNNGSLWKILKTTKHLKLIKIPINSKASFQSECINLYLSSFGGCIYLAGIRLRDNTLFSASGSVHSGTFLILPTTSSCTSFQIRSGPFSCTIVIARRRCIPYKEYVYVKCPSKNEQCRQIR